jgi:MFS family permease
MPHITYLMGCTIDLMTMKPSSSSSVGNIAGAVSIVCFLALASVVTLGDVFMDEDEDTDRKESFISWLWIFWLLCLLGVVVVLMRLRNDGHGFLYRLEMGMLALMQALDAVNHIASSRWGYSLFFATVAMMCFAQECRKQSPRVTALFCNAQMFGSFFLVAISFIPITLDAIMANKDLLMKWTTMAIMGILTVSCFVVAFVVPPVIILVEEPLADPAVLLPAEDILLAQAAEDQSKTTMSSSSNFDMNTRKLELNT